MIKLANPISSAPLLLLLASAIAPAQYIDIESRTYFDFSSTPHKCGAPGYAGCPSLPTCSNPLGLRDDAYLHVVVCDLAGSAEYDKSLPSTLPPSLTAYFTGQWTPSDTLFTSTDLHFGKETFTEADHVHHVSFLNQFAFAHRVWPGGVGFPVNESINPPTALVTTGDDTHYGHQEELGAYRLLYEQSWLNESIQFLVLPGFGNHDISGECQANNCAQRMWDYQAGHVQGGVNNFDTGSRNYSWDWNGVHYVQLNTWAGDTLLGAKPDHTPKATHNSGLSWLNDDLSANVSTSGRPVVIFQHFGLDPMSVYENWWTYQDRLDFWNAIKQYNVIGMFTGHIHHTGMYDFADPSSNGSLTGNHIDDFVGGTGGETEQLVGNAEYGNAWGHFFVVRVTPESNGPRYLDVASVKWRSEDTVPHFAGLSGQNQYEISPGFVGGATGCRKLIDGRLDDVSSLVSGVGNVAMPPTAVITITNTSQSTISGPLALAFDSLVQSVNLNSKSFVDRCFGGRGADPGGSSYQYPDGGANGDLAPGQSLHFTATFNARPASLTLRLVHVGKAFRDQNGAVVNWSGSSATNPALGSRVIYGPPNESFTIAIGNKGATPAQGGSTVYADWLSVTPMSSSFNQYGFAVLNYTLNPIALSATQDTRYSADITVWHLNAALSSGAYFFRLTFVPTVTFNTVPSGLQVIWDGSPFTAPAIQGTSLNSNHTLSVPTPQLATGTRYEFSRWQDGSVANPRSFTETHTETTFTAVFSTKYLLGLVPLPQAGGTIAAQSPSADSYYPANSTVTFTATPNPGYYFSSFTVNGGLLPSISANPANITMNGVRLLWANFAVQQVPAVTWPTPADIVAGTALGPQQLNAAANVPGTFVYAPAAGTLLPAADHQVLGVTFIPSSPEYKTTKTTVNINVKPAGSPILAITQTLVRDSSNNVVVKLAITNRGGGAAKNVTIAAAFIGATAGTPVPQLLPDIPAGGLINTAVTFPGSVGSPGTSALLEIGGSYSGNNINTATAITLP